MRSPISLNKPKSPDNTILASIKNNFAGGANGNPSIINVLFKTNGTTSLAFTKNNFAGGAYGIPSMVNVLLGRDNILVAFT